MDRADLNAVRPMHWLFQEGLYGSPFNKLSDERGRLNNLFENLPTSTTNEEFTELLSRPGARIERIVSNGQATPVDTPFNQDHDEWVMLLRGTASLWIDGDKTHDLHPGDHVLIPAHCIHRVTRTAMDEATIWLAIHFC